MRKRSQRVLRRPKRNRNGDDGRRSHDEPIRKTHATCTDKNEETGPRGQRRAIAAKHERETRDGHELTSRARNHRKREGEKDGLAELVAKGARSP